MINHILTNIVQMEHISGIKFHMRYEKNILLIPQSQKVCNKLEKSEQAPLNLDKTEIPGRKWVCIRRSIQSEDENEFNTIKVRTFLQSEDPRFASYCNDVLCL